MRGFFTRHIWVGFQGGFPPSLKKGHNGGLSGLHPDDPVGVVEIGCAVGIDFVERIDERVDFVGEGGVDVHCGSI
jgi:hypothetical protein